MRLFVAIRPSADVREILLDTMEGIEGARWQDEENLHVTLRFVGEVDGRVAEDLAASLGRVRMTRFSLSLNGVGHFERSRRGSGRPHALWAQVAPSEALRVLQGRVEQACRMAGLTAETRRFVPHVTIARLGGGSGPVGPCLAQHGRLAAGPWEVDRFLLFESHLSPSGAEYEPLVHYPLE